MSDADAGVKKKATAGSERAERINTGNGNLRLFKSNYCSGKSGRARSCSSLCPPPTRLPLPPPPHGAALCVYKRGVMVAECVSAAGYFVFGGEDMANQTTSHMKGSSRSI